MCGVCLSKSTKKTRENGLFVFPDNNIFGEFYWVCYACRLNLGFSDDIFEEKKRIGERIVDEYKSGKQNIKPGYMETDEANAGTDSETGEIPAKTISNAGSEGD